MIRRKLEDLIAERDRIGTIIDENNLNGVPLWAYVVEYDSLTAEIEKLESESDS